MAISDFADMMPHTVTHEAFSSRDAYGAKTYAASVSYSARVTYKNELIRADDGSQVVAKGAVWFLGTPTINAEDQITLPDSTTPPILAVNTISDQDGTHHVKVMFG